MQNRNRGSYEIAGSEIVAEGADLRVSVLTLAAGQCVPWQYHGDITDSFVCLEARWSSRRERRDTSTSSNQASAARCRPRRRITCMAKRWARASS
jgi:hypothetical protein